MFKIYESHPADEKHTLTPGEIVTDRKTFMKIACGKGLLLVYTIQTEGKKKMSISDFLRGFKIQDYTITSTKQA